MGNEKKVVVPESKSRIAECDGCGIVDEVKKKVTSCLHPHPAASKAQKFIKADIVFINLETGELAELCKSCQSLVIGGAADGKNWR